jgi:hypothetical protein
MRFYAAGTAGVALGYTAHFAQQEIERLPRPAAEVAVDLGGDLIKVAVWPLMAACYVARRVGRFESDPADRPQD